MEFVPYRLLRNEPKALRQKLAEDGQLVVTVDGKPFAIMIELPENENVEELLVLVSRIRAQMAVRAIRSQARMDGLDQMNDAQVDEIIARTRKDLKP